MIVGDDISSWCPSYSVKGVVPHGTAVATRSYLLLPMLWALSRCSRTVDLFKVVIVLVAISGSQSGFNSRENIYTRCIYLPGTQHIIPKEANFYVNLLYISHYNLWTDHDLSVDRSSIWILTCRCDILWRICIRVVQIDSTQEELLFCRDVQLPPGNMS